MSLHSLRIGGQPQQTVITHADNFNPGNEGSLQILLSQRRGYLGHFTIACNDLDCYLDENDLQLLPSVINDLVINLDNAYQKYLDSYDCVLKCETVELNQIERLMAKNTEVTHRYGQLKSRALSRVSVDLPYRADNESFRQSVVDKYGSVKSAKSTKLSHFSSKIARQAKKTLLKAEVIRTKEKVAQADLEVELAKMDLADVLEGSQATEEDHISRERTSEWVNYQNLQSTQARPSNGKRDTPLPRRRQEEMPSVLRPTAPEWVPHPHPQHFLQAPLFPPFVSVPRPDLLTFSGSSADYVAFISNFMTHIGSQPIAPSLKLGYLLQYCKGDAKAAIRDCVVLQEDDGYRKALSILKCEFGKPHVIAKSHLDAIVHGDPIHLSDSQSLTSLARKMQSCLIALTEVDYAANLNSDVTLNSIAMRLPKPLRVRWVERASSIHSQRNRQPRFEDLRDFISERAQVAGSSFAQILDSTQQPTKQKEKIALVTEAKNDNSRKYPSKKPGQPKPDDHGTWKKECVVCGEDHFLSRCEVFLMMRPEDRFEKVKGANLCFNCLRKGHRASECPKESFCKQGCKYKHSKFLHRDKEDEKAVTCHSTGSEKSSVSLQVVKVIVSAGKKSRITFALLDQCSNVTLCEESLARELNIKQSNRSSMSVNTVNGMARIRTTKIKLTVANLDHSQTLHLSNVYTVERLPYSPGKSPGKEDMQRWPHLEDVHLPFSSVDRIGLLIGADHPEVFKVLDTRESLSGLPGEPYAVRYPLGWTVIGPMGSSHNSASNAFTVHCIQADHDGLEEQISRLWNNEYSDPVPDHTAMSLEDKQALSIMKESAHLDEEGHWNIRLPWKIDPPPLIDNLPQAEARLKNLLRKLKFDPSFQEEYTQKMNSYIDKGFATLVVSDDSLQAIPRWYLPHHAVFHPQKRKLRVVFDCSAKFNGISLNDQLLQGPDFLNSLVGVVLRFRQGVIAIAADVEAMFHQVRVPPSDRNALCFLWYEDGDISKPISTYQMTVHLFGATSSPSVCCFALRLTAENQKANCHQITHDTIMNNFYMDDLLKSVNSAEEASQLVEELISILKKGGFRLTKWISNSSLVIDGIPIEERADGFKKLEDEQFPVERALGIMWDVQQDAFRFRISPAADKPLTRRGMLSEISSLYDPCGFSAPVLLKAKTLHQLLSIRKHDWDDPLPVDIEEVWGIWKSELPLLAEESVPRCFTPTNSGTVVDRELHVFADASEVGYAAVAYIRVKDHDGNVYVTIVLGKARLCPAKFISVPRLELTAATLAAKLASFICKEGEQNLNKVFFWTDSTTVLQYLRNTSRRFKIFVANRIAIIRGLSNVDQWHHVPSELNPADVGSRGIMPSNKARFHFWLKGPSFLVKNEKEWPKSPLMTDVAEDNIEVRNARSAIISLTVAGEDSVVERIVQRSSSWIRLVRVVAYVRRFISLCKRIPSNKECLTVEEITESTAVLLKHSQMKAFKEEYTALQSGKMLKGTRLQPLCPFMEDGLIRVGGRLKRASIPSEAKNPIILPSNDHLSVLLVRHYHKESGHSGVDYVLSQLRSKYWILKGRVLVRKIIKDPKSGCILCKRYAATLQKQLMADLPSARVCPAEHPFQEVGIDYFGPIRVKFRRGTAKRYGCIFTCLSSRAVHIEIAHSLDTKSFLGAFQRFVARRGRPTNVYSDNGTNFVSGCKEIKENWGKWNASYISDCLSQNEIQWNFNPPSASHMGGVWERLIQSIRRILEKLLGEQLVNDEALLTIMTEVERILNDRPLWPPSNDCRDKDPLKPNDLLLPHSNDSLPLGIFSMEDDYPRRWWRQANYLISVFWKRWISEYLPMLQVRRKWLKPMNNLKVGDVVLISNEATPRGQWPIARVHAIFPDQKGQVRIVEVRMRGKIFKRPIHKLCLLEMA